MVFLIGAAYKQGVCPGAHDYDVWGDCCGCVLQRQLPPGDCQAPGHDGHPASWLRSAPRLFISMLILTVRILMQDMPVPGWWLESNLRCQSALGMHKHVL